MSYYDLVIVFLKGRQNHSHNIAAKISQFSEPLARFPTMPRGPLGQALRTSGLGFSCFNLSQHIWGKRNFKGEGLYQELQSRKAPEEIQKVGRLWPNGTLNKVPKQKMRRKFWVDWKLVPISLTPPTQWIVLKTAGLKGGGERGSDVHHSYLFSCTNSELLL